MRDTSGLYNGLIADGLLRTTSQLVEEPANIVASMLGYQELPTWDSESSEGDVLEVGAASVNVDLVTGNWLRIQLMKCWSSRLGWAEEAERNEGDGFED